MSPLRLWEEVLLIRGSHFSAERRNLYGQHYRADNVVGDDNDDDGGGIDVKWSVLVGG